MKPDTIVDARIGWIGAVAKCRQHRKSNDSSIDDLRMAAHSGRASDKHSVMDVMRGV